MGKHITASMLYNLVHCPHRVSKDLFADPAERDPANPFVELLWEKGTLFERQVMAELDVPFLDLSRYSPDERERRTAAAIAGGSPLIYGGRIHADDLLGDPDLLRKEGAGYIAGDIKSGSGEEGPEENSRPKLHYAVQLALYTDILQRLGCSAGRRAFVWDVHGEEVPYDLAAELGKRGATTLWQQYQEALRQARAIIHGKERTLPAYGAPCKLCHWYSACVRHVREIDDLTMIPELGRSKRDVMLPEVGTVTALAMSDPDAYVRGGKTLFAGIGPATLRKFHDRARLLTGIDPRPYLREPVRLPVYDCELFFDIEVDPMREFCYLHGFIERRGGDNRTEEYVSFFATEPTPDAEQIAFADAVTFIRSRRPCAIWFYSKYERTWYRRLSEQYPGVCSPEEIEDIFGPDHAVDLYTDLVKRATEWPTWDHSIKTLASYLGFRWRDTHPSGAASIEWFHRWVESGDPALRRRILAYNEDDCRATRVLRDGIAALPVKAEALPRHERSDIGSTH